MPDWVLDLYDISAGAVFEKHLNRISDGAFFKDGACTDIVEVEYPIGHRRRRAEGLPLLKKKFNDTASTRLSAGQCKTILPPFHAPPPLDPTPLTDFLQLSLPQPAPPPPPV